MSRKYLLSLVLIGALGAAPARADDFAVRDGDTVVFMGDSITAARAYSKIVENYTLLRYPGRKVRFHNVGIGGDTMAGGLKRLERDVFGRGATLLTVAFGINDIGWGTRADDVHKRAYLDAVRGIVSACKQRGVRVYICSAAVTAADPSTSEDDYLQKMCDEGMALSRELGGAAIDVQRGMREIQKRIWAANEKTPDKSKHATLHAADGIHLNDLGQLAMAFAILKGLGAPADVSAANFDARGPKLVRASGCTISDVAAKDNRLEFTRHDEGLPLNYGLFFALNFRFVPIPDQLNRYLLTVTNLPAGRYEVLADGRSAGRFTAAELAAGVNLASTTPDPWQPGGPWNAQANLLQHLTDARYQVDLAQAHGDVFLPGSPAATALHTHGGKADAEIIAAQRAVARPQAYRFVIQPYQGKEQ